MVEPEIVRAIRDLHELRWGSKRIAKQLGIARNTVRRYFREGMAAETQVRPNARCLSPEEAQKAVELFEDDADGNAVVVHEMLAENGIEASLRTVQRVVAPRRQEIAAAEAATVRFETAPGEQAQVDFGQRMVRIGDELVRVLLLVVVLGYSRRIFVRAFLHERQDDWREGIAAAFRHFGGIPRTLLVDNARALVKERDSEANIVRFQPSFLAFCKDWDLTPKACKPYRARTKGKVESGIKYVKRNAIAKRRFESFAALEAHLVQWQNKADKRVHGTTNEVPIERFLRDEVAVLRPLPLHPLKTRQKAVVRQVSNDAFVEVETVRYSVPYKLVRERVEVLVGEDVVRIFRGAKAVAEHRRSREPHDIVLAPEHHAGLWRSSWSVDRAAASGSPLEALGRSLGDYQAVIVEATR